MKQHRNWVIAAFVILLAIAIAAGTSDLWRPGTVNEKGKGYVAVIRIDGPIYGGPDTEALFSNGGNVTSEQLMKEFKMARQDPQAKAILVRINSPGGSTGATQEISEEMDKIRSSGKPIVISMGDMCASAGYWLASKGNYIFATPATITGSIGVYMDYSNIEGLMDKLGVKNEKIKSGAHKDILSMYRPMTEEERSMVQSMVDDIYNQFVQTVADGRKMDEAKVRTIADGRIMTGKQAQDLGLVDAMGNYYDALSYAASSGGIEGENIPVKSYSGGMSLRGILSGEARGFADIFAAKLAESFSKALLQSDSLVVK